MPAPSVRTRTSPSPGSGSGRRSTPMVPLVITAARTDRSVGSTVASDRIGGAVGELDGKVAVVTGGASGIGLATARRLAAAGATVVIGDLAEDLGSAAADEIGGTFVRIDVGEPEEWAALVEATVAELGGIDIAHLNAGIATGTSDILEVTDERYRAIMRANVDGVILGARAVLPAIDERGGG